MLGNLFLPIRTKNAMKKHVSLGSPSYSDAEQIGVIFQYQNDQHYEKVLNFVRQLQIDKKQVSTLVFFPKNDQESSYKIPRYSPHNLSVWGKLTSEEIELFLAKSFDFLINLELGNQEFIDNILSRANARCTIGNFKTERQQLYQMMIHIDPSIDFEDFLEKVYFYIKKLRANA